MSRPSFKAIAGLPWPEQYARLSDPAFKAKMLGEENVGVEDVYGHWLPVAVSALHVGHPPDGVQVQTLVDRERVATAT